MEYAIFCADLWQLLPVPVARDEELVKLVIEKEEQFWRMVENGPQPDRLEWGDSRCKGCYWRLTCWGDKWEDLEAEEEGKDVDYEDYDDKDFIELTKEYSERKQLLKEADKLCEETKAELKEIVGERQKVKCENGKVCYKWEQKEGFDKNKFKKERPKTYAKYIYNTGSRPFRFFAPKRPKGE
jgi:hypothetical protein